VSATTERRRAKRRPILETFSVFAVVPTKGPNRQRIHDVSDFGVGFDLDVEGEPSGSFALKKGDSLEMHFYLNQSLFVPLSVTIARLETKDGIRQIGAEIKDRKSPSYKAIHAFVELLDVVMEVGQIARI
jgi:hypothetical protein